MIVVGVIGLLSAIAIPTFNKARNDSRKKTMQSNVRLLNQAVEMWAMDTLATDSTPIAAGITNYVKGGLEGLAVGSMQPGLTNITGKTVGYTFTLSDIY